VTHGVCQIIWANEHGINAFYGCNGSCVGNAFGGFNHHNQSHAFIAVFDMFWPTKSTITRCAATKSRAALTADTRCACWHGVFDLLYQPCGVGGGVDHRDLQCACTQIQRAGNVGLQAAHRCGHARCQSGAQHVFGGFKTRRAMLVVNQYKVKTGIGAHFNNGGGRYAVEHGMQNLLAAQQT